MLLATTTVADKGMNRWVSNGEVITRWIEACVTSGVYNFRTAAAALAFGPGQHIQFGAMGEEGEIAAALRAVLGGLWLQVAWAAPLAEVVLKPAPDATAVFGPDVDGQADKDEQDTFEGSWIELHELKG